MKVLYSPQFSNRYNRLPEETKEKAEKKEKIFRNNPFDLRLKTHKLHGGMSKFWAFSIDIRHRIVFKFEENGSVKFYTIGVILSIFNLGGVA